MPASWTLSSFFVTALLTGSSGFDEELPIKQDQCTESAYQTPDVDQVSVRSDYPSIVVGIERHKIRCGTELTAWLKRRPEGHQVVFRPRDMNPRSEAKCFCLVNVQTLLADVPAAPRQGLVPVHVYKQEAHGPQRSKAVLLRTVNVRHQGR